MSEAESPRGFKAIPKGEEPKEELEGFYHDPAPAEQLNKLGKHRSAPQASEKRYLVMLFLLAALLAAAVIVADYHFSSGVIKAVEEKQNGSAGKDQLSARLAEIEANERKILDQMVIILGDDSTANSAPGMSAGRETGALGQLKQDIHSLSKQLTLVKQDIATTNKNVEAQAEESLSELAEIKGLVLAAQPVNATRQPAAAEHAAEQPFTAASEEYVGKDFVFDIPKKLWMFKKESHSNYLDELCYQNNAHFASLSHYQVAYVDSSNYRQYLSPSGAEGVHGLIQLLRKRARGDSTSSLKYHIDSIASKLILLTILQENGGIVSSGEYAMTEDLAWVNTIASNPYVNRGNRGIRPQVVGFYSFDYSLEKTREKLKPSAGLEETDKYVTVFPALEDYFIAAQKDARFLRRLLEEMEKLLREPGEFQREKVHYKLVNLKGEDIYYEYFLIAVQVVLQERQRTIDAARLDGFRHLAIDDYGLQLINCYYAPYKLKSFWGNEQTKKAFQSLSQYPQEELFANIGPMRYIARITPVGTMSDYLVETKNGQRPPLLMGSFLQRIFFPAGTQPFLQKNPEAPFVNSSSAPWAGLPKTIWVFWDKGLANAGLNNQICVENLRRMGGLSGFKVVEVNLSNLHEYLDKETLERIDNTIRLAKLTTYPQSKPDLYRLALLSKHGGIYMDASYVALESFDWLVNIGRYPSQFIFNRYGALPKVFMMWHPHYGAPLKWTVNKQHNVKSQWHLAYENNFIAAEKGSELVKEWF